MEIKPSIVLWGMKGDGLSCHEPLKALVVQWKWFVVAGIHLLINFPLLILSLIQRASRASLCCTVAGAQAGEKQLRASGILAASRFWEKSFLAHFSIDGVTDVPIN